MKKENLPAVAAMLVIISGMALLHLPCPIRFLTGVSCPGCGMMRAWQAVFAGQLYKAPALHPCFWLGPAVVLFILVQENLSEKTRKAAFLFLVIPFLGVYVYRLIFRDPVVVVDPASGFVVRLMHSFIF